MATNQQQYAEQLRILQERFAQEPIDKLIRLLQRHAGDVDQVRALLVHREHRANKLNTLEARFGTIVTELQQEFPSAQQCKRIRLLKTMECFGGDVEQVRKFLQRNEERRNQQGENSGVSRRQKREELKTKYATQIAELATAGINVNSPCLLRQLEKNQGDVNKIIEKNSRRTEKKEKLAELDTKYANQIAQLEADGVTIKNKRILIRLLEKADGQIDVVKQLLNERKVKHEQRKEYRHKHRSKSPNKTTEETNQTLPIWKKRRELSVDDINNLKRLRTAGVHGNPMKVLSIFYECNQSIEMTIARTAEERERRARSREERKFKRTLLSEAHNAYITINNRDDWPHNIEHVYFDGNNMMFVVDCLRRLCLNRAGKKTERALGEIASAWNEQMHIPHVELIFDSTNQVEQIGTVKVTSAQPKYRTTDDMLVEIVRQPENREKNKRTIIVTSDRALATLLQREGCLLVKPYNWFAHCVMTLTPDLINYEELTGMMTKQSTPTTFKIRYNFDELVHRIAKIDI
ncbi:unnamed protein product [Rotaria sp. Silwood1]|nr:unnamed protein product [Rotaria sp. Silwood1]CAF0840236.1 unnamed protein product [Rotaria sp. Silwood1]CAF3364137.1 unnamed protein product [Rotaria sp. Silwood1]CAF4728991.1 unnamed protein product [Rotaria sp. Silwood1]